MIVGYSGRLFPHGMVLKFSGLFVLVFLSAGCTQMRTTDTSRTATEQFLVSVAVNKAIANLNTEPLSGYGVYIDDPRLKRLDQEYVSAEFRAAVVKAGANLVQHREDAELIIEFRSDGIGIDKKILLIGIPGIPIPGIDPTTAALGGGFTTPELPIFKTQIQNGYASVSYIAYWRKQGNLYISSGPYIGKSTRRDGWLFALGPMSRGDIPQVK
jgi:hypothetical protein